MFKQSFSRIALPLATASFSGLALSTTLAPVDAKASAVDMLKVRKDIEDLIDSDSEKRADGTSLTGTFVRLAWHCAGTYAKASDGAAASGGSNGARQRFNPEASYGGNAGLAMARAALEPIKKANPEISYADLYTLSGVVAVENATGPKVPFRLGREDFVDGSTSRAPEAAGLPDADKGAPPKTIAHIREVFNRMGFDDRQMVALCGAHALGRCHVDASGYWGPWGMSENVFSNDYFRLLLEETWTIKKTHNGAPWTGPEQYEDKTGKIMMLPSDIALIQDPEFKKIVELYAKDEDTFFKDFSAAFSKLLELGVPFPKPWYKLW